MKRTTTLALAAASVLATSFAVPIAAKHHEDAKESHHFRNVMMDKRRDNDRARDKFRHPVQTLNLFDVQPWHTVIEYAAGGGWYTRILAPLVAGKGKYIAINPNPEIRPMSEERKVSARKWAAAFPARAAEWTGLDAGQIDAFTTDNVPETMHGTVDRILIFRMMHNMKRQNFATAEIKALRKFLKEDGMVGIVQHRAKADAPFSYADGNKGYLRQADVVKFMEINGFELAKEGNFNANPKDTADYSVGVWTLPPRLALDEKDKEKYLAIGESDRMTLLFRKRP